MVYLYAREGREQGVWRTLFGEGGERPAVLKAFQLGPPSKKPLRVSPVGNKKRRALESGASGAHKRRDIMMYSPQAHPGHNTSHEPSSHNTVYQHRQNHSCLLAKVVNGPLKAFLPGPHVLLPRAPPQPGRARRLSPLACGCPRRHQPARRDATVICHDGTWECTTNFSFGT